MKLIVRDVPSKFRDTLWLTGWLCLFGSCLLSWALHANAADVSAERLLQADQDNSNWMLHGRTYSEQRYSPLEQINRDNLGRLGLAWSYDMRTPRLTASQQALITVLRATSGS